MDLIQLAFNQYWLLHVPLLFVLCLFVREHDFCKKMLYNFNVTWGVS